MHPISLSFVSQGNGDERVFLLAARRRKKSKSSNYLISLSVEHLSRDAEEFVGKVRANFVGTSFTVYDNGENPRKGKSLYLCECECECVVGW